MLPLLSLHLAHFVLPHLVSISLIRYSLPLMQGLPLIHGLHASLVWCSDFPITYFLRVLTVRAGSERTCHPSKLTRPLPPPHDGFSLNCHVSEHFHCWKGWHSALLCHTWYEARDSALSAINLHVELCTPIYQGEEIFFIRWTWHAARPAASRQKSICKDPMTVNITDHR